MEVCIQESLSRAIISQSIYELVEARFSIKSPVWKTFREPPSQGLPELTDFHFDGCCGRVGVFSYFRFWLVSALYKSERL
jgi:hypothetical protein